MMLSKGVDGKNEMFQERLNATFLSIFVCFSQTVKKWFFYE